MIKITRAWDCSLRDTQNIAINTKVYAHILKQQYICKTKWKCSTCFNLNSRNAWHQKVQNSFSRCKLTQRRLKIKTSFVLKFQRL